MGNMAELGLSAESFLLRFQPRNLFLWARQSFLWLAVTYTEVTYMETGYLFKYMEVMCVETGYSATNVEVIGI
jgi:hypothetical protein